MMMHDWAAPVLPSSEDALDIVLKFLSHTDFASVKKRRFPRLSEIIAGLLYIFATLELVKGRAPPTGNSIPACSPKYHVSACFSDLGQFVTGKIVRGDFCALRGNTTRFKSNNTIQPCQEETDLIC